MDDLRFFKTKNIIIDLDRVDSILIDGSNTHGNYYFVYLTSGVAMKPFFGAGLITQFKKYKGIEYDS